MRAAIERCISEWRALAVVLLGAAVQGWALFNPSSTFHSQSHFDLGAIRIGIDKSVRFFFVGALTTDNDHHIGVGFLILTAMTFICVVWRREILDRYFALLVAAWALLCLIVPARAPIEVVHPFLAGPRYFFYPYILFTWIGIWVAAKTPRPIGAMLAGAYAVAVVIAWHGMSRHHDPIDWQANVQACATASGPYDMPVHFDGTAADAWKVPFSGDECRRLIAASILG